MANPSSSGMGSPGEKPVRIKYSSLRKMLKEHSQRKIVKSPSIEELLDKYAPLPPSATSSTSKREFSPASRGHATLKYSASQPLPSQVLQPPQSVRTASQSLKPVSPTCFVKANSAHNLYSSRTPAENPSVLSFGSLDSATNHYNQFGVGSKDPGDSVSSRFDCRTLTRQKESEHTWMDSAIDLHHRPEEDDTTTHTLKPHRSPHLTHCQNTQSFTKLHSGPRLTHMPSVVVSDHSGSMLPPSPVPRSDSDSLLIRPHQKLERKLSNSSMNSDRSDSSKSIMSDSSYSVDDDDFFFCSRDKVSKVLLWYSEIF